MKKMVASCLLVAILPGVIFSSPVKVSAKENIKIEQNINNSVDYNQTDEEINEIIKKAYEEFNNTDQSDIANDKESRSKLKKFKKFVKDNWKDIIDTFCRVVDTITNVIDTFYDRDTNVTTNPKNNYVGYGYQTLGGHVGEAQKILKQRGYSLAVDNQFGPTTQDCVKRFQRSQGLSADGIVGYNTWAYLHGK